MIHGYGADKNETYTTNGLNQYPSIIQDGTNYTLTYDGNGSLLGDGTWAYAYDVENRLIAASGPGVAATYAYDPLGRRASKSGSGVAPEEYLSDGVEEIADYDGAGVLLRRYVHGPGVDEPLLMTVHDGAGAETDRQYYHADHLGSVVAMSDAMGAIADTYTYSAWGEVNDPSGNPFRFTGRRLDAETGLYYYRARYYSSAIGRFLQTDPIGYGDNMNMYAYVANDPVNATDPSGENEQLREILKSKRSALQSARKRPFSNRTGKAIDAAKSAISNLPGAIAAPLEKGAAKEVLSMAGKALFVLSVMSDASESLDTAESPAEFMGDVGGSIIAETGGGLLTAGTTRATGSPAAGAIMGGVFTEVAKPLIGDTIEAAVTLPEQAANFMTEAMIGLVEALMPEEQEK